MTFAQLVADVVARLDAAEIVASDAIDRSYVEGWVEQLGLQRLWERVAR